MVVEELHQRDLLGFLWRCRQDNSGFETSCDMTEKRIFTMAGQVASALEYLHSQRCVHGNVGARSVLVGGDLTAKLWGLGSAYRRTTQVDSPGEVEHMELRKWQAPEVLACRYSIIKSCCQWDPQQRLSMSELIRKLQAGEKSANGRTVLRVPEPLNIEKYLREAGYGEAYNYAVL
ncbi:tyrosine-protein kinase STYK1-like [Thunnus maccoyii]|uniref:tyrosine-protein kinase STYK1-like n=1 Tax=Thunnus maccoyii TaxID=8240 RepID=UPI001C4C5FDB|nr:tyrosine-protein kinase STYK1-like [Thunnus maccoyii]